MRFLLSFLIWIMTVGGLWLYTSHRDATLPVAAPPPALQTLAGSFSIELTPTFSVENDPFALQTEQSSSGLELKVNSQPVPLPETPLLRGMSVRINNIQGILLGHNDIYLKASPPLAESHMEHGVRVKIYADMQVLADTTLWSSQGSLVSGVVNFTMNENETEAGHEH